jgi:hypothetical protein
MDVKLRIDFSVPLLSGRRLHSTWSSPSCPVCPPGEPAENHARLPDGRMMKGPMPLEPLTQPLTPKTPPPKPPEEHARTALASQKSSDRPSITGGAPTQPPNGRVTMSVTGTKTAQESQKLAISGGDKDDD